MYTEARELARGRWHYLLQSFGIEASHLNGRHGPCPICGGKDRFRFDDKEGRGTFICNHCGAGDGFDLLMRYFGWAFKEAAAAVRLGLGADLPALPPSDTAEKKVRVKADANALARLWCSARPVVSGDPVDTYLRTRGLHQGAWPSDLRFCASCFFRSEDSQSRRSMPAMLAIVRDRDGRMVNIQKTFLDGSRKASIPAPRQFMRGGIPAGAAIRLHPAGPVLGIAEGVETALAAASLFGLPVWSALSAASMKNWQPPRGVNEVVVFADNDINRVGQEAAASLAKTLSRCGIVVSVRLPEQAGADWADVLAEGLAY